MMGTNQQQTAPHGGQLSISKEEEEEEEEERKRNMENNEAYIIEAGYRESARLGYNQTSVPVNQPGPWSHQYDTFSNHRQSPAFTQQADILRQFDHHTGQQQHAEAQVRNHQSHPSQEDSVRIQTLMAQIVTLNQQLQQEKREKEYFKLKTLEFYIRLCILEPGMPAGHRQRAETLLASNSTLPTFTGIPSVTIPSDHRPSARIPSAVLSASHPFAPPPSAATPSVPHTSIPHPSIPHSCIPRPSASRPWAHHPSAPPPSAYRSSAPRPSAPPPPANLPSAPLPSASPPPADRPSTPRPFAPRHGAVISSNPSRHTPHSASPVTASALHIDLTIDDIPPSSHTSQKRKWASEQERQAGDHLRRNILTKKFEWMEPKDRPNFMNRNPYKPLDIDPTEHEQYPTQARHYGHDPSQASQEPPLAPSQAPANLPTLAKLPNSKKNKPSGPRARRLDKDKLGGKAKNQSMSEARERMKAKKRQISQEQNAAMAENSLEQEAEDNETMAAEMEAWLEEQEDPGDNEMMATEMEAMLEQEDTEDSEEL